MTKGQGKDRPKDPTEARGIREFRMLVLFFSSLYAGILTVACGNELVIYLRAVARSDEIPGKGLQEQATLTYYVVWLLVAALGLVLALRKSTSWMALYVDLLIIGEFCAHGYFAATHRHLYRPTPPALYDRFDPHPFVIASPRPNLVIYPGYTHDSDGHRTTVNKDKHPDARSIFVFGGSTTYDANPDGETWPSQLSAMLGPDFVVTNYGVPGFSSVEALTQSLFAFRDKPPSCAVYLEGANDLRNSHAANLSSDYSNFEYPNLVETLALDRKPTFVMQNSLLISYLMSMFSLPVAAAPSGEISGEPDLRLSKIYRDNIRLIAVVGRTFGVSVIFVPAVINYAAAEAPGRSDSAGPFIKTKDISRLLSALNQDMAAGAAQGNAYFIGAPLSESWSPQDFHDLEHFSTQGSRKFANIIVGSVRKICR